LVLPKTRNGIDQRQAQGGIVPSVMIFKVFVENDTEKHYNYSNYKKSMKKE
jgi:hypothetical protein